MARYNRDQVLELLDGPEDEIDSGDEFDGYVDETEMMQVMDANEGNDDNEEVEIEETNGEMMTENSDGSDSFSREASQNQDFVEGPACSLDMSNKTPIDYFEHLMTDSILDHIVSQTNLYADQHFEANPDIPRQSRLHTALQWQDKRLVTMLSTIHNDDIISKRRRTRHA